MCVLGIYTWCICTFVQRTNKSESLVTVKQSMTTTLCTFCALLYISQDWNIDLKILAEGIMRVVLVCSTSFKDKTTFNAQAARVISAKSGTGEPSSSSVRVCCIYICTYALGKGMNWFLPLTVMNKIVGQTRLFSLV